MLSTFCVSSDTSVNNLGLYVIFFLVACSEIAAVCNIAISAITGCIAGDFQLLLNGCTTEMLPFFLDSREEWLPAGLGSEVYLAKPGSVG